MPSDSHVQPAYGLRFSLKALLAATGVFCVTLAATYHWHAGALFDQKEPEFLTRAFHGRRVVIWHVFSPVFAGFLTLSVMILHAALRCVDIRQLAAYVSLAAPGLLLPVLSVIGMSWAFPAVIGSTCYALASTVMIAEKNAALASWIVIVNLGWMLSMAVYFHCLLQFASEL